MFVIETIVAFWLLGMLSLMALHDPAD